MSVKVGLGASSAGSPARRRISARAKVVLAGAEIARQRDEIARADPFGDQRGECRRRRFVGQIDAPGRSGIRLRPAHSGDCAAAEPRRPATGKMQVTVVPSLGAEFDQHASAVQFDERAHDREADAEAAVARADGMRLEALEHPVEHFGGNAAAAVGDLEDDLVAAGASPRASPSGRAPRSRSRWRED